MTFKLQAIKKCPDETRQTDGQTDGRTDGQTDGQGESYIAPTPQVVGV